MANFWNPVLCLFCQLFLYILIYFPKSPSHMLLATRTKSHFVLSYANTSRILIPMEIWKLLLTNELLIVVVWALLAAPSSQEPLCCFQPQLPVLPKHFSKLCGKLVTKWKTIVSTLDKPRGSSLQYILLLVVRNSALERKGYWQRSHWTSCCFDFFVFGFFVGFFLVGCCQTFCRLLFDNYILKQIDVPLIITLCIHVQKLKVNFGSDLFQWKFIISSCGGGYNITIILGNLKIRRSEDILKFHSAVSLVVLWSQCHIYQIAWNFVLIFFYWMRQNTNMPKKIVLAFSLLVYSERGNIVLTVGVIKFMLKEHVFLNE